MDRISDLPEGISVHILSFLDTIDQVKTSALSRQWRDRWLLIPNLKFDQTNVFGRNHIKFDGDHDYPSFEKHRSEFLQIVNHYMNQRQRIHMSTGVPRMLSLEVTFFLGLEQSSSSSLDQWIQFAIEAGSEKVEVLLSHEPYFLKNFILDESTCYSFPLWLLSKTRSRLRHLSLQRCSINSYCPGDFSPMKNLITLKLENVYIGDHFMKGLLSITLQLKELILHSCKISTEKLHLVSSSLVVLKVFHLPGCREVAISGLNLTSFAIGGRVPKVSSLEAPSLSKCSFTTLVTQTEFGLLTSLPQLEELTLAMGAHAVLTPIVETTPYSKDVSFTSLKRLVLGFMFYECVDISWVSAVLRAFPLLQNLEVMFPGDVVAGKPLTSSDILRMQTPPVELTHNELKYVEISGWYGNKYETEFASLLLRAAIRLERIKISPLMTHLNYNGELAEWDYKDYSPWYCSKREILRRWLQSQVPNGVDFILE